MNINYFEIFKDLKQWLIKRNPTSTTDITSSIKEYFSNRFQNYTVLPNDNSSEYLLDIMVTNFTPLKIIETDRNSLSITLDSLENHIAVESELGGSGGSSAYGVQKNVVEDYVKLLLVNAKYKIMIFTSLPYANENNHVANRVANLREIYLKVCPSEQGVLLVHLPGAQPSSTQVQACVDGLSGYIISGNGEHVGQIAT